MNIYREYSKLVYNILSTNTKEIGRKHEKCRKIQNHDIEHTTKIKFLDSKFLTEELC